MSDPAASTRNFIEQIIEADNASGKWAGRVCTRFPPEPNGYLHIGHAKSICLNFGLALKYAGQCNLRFDDTNPAAEEDEYVKAIIDDVSWLGFQWAGEVRYASDYFDRMYAWACELIRKGRAYVCDLPLEEVRRMRGTLTKPGENSPQRDRSVEENLDLFDRMRNGEFPDGARTLRAKIDMAHTNLNMRDPVMYRILRAPHHRTGTAWNIYPMYDWAHGLEDSIEAVTHSICTLEFENHRPLYNWYIDAVNEGRTEDGSGDWGRRIAHPQQIEFARLELTYVVTSKRKLLELVKTGVVRGWDDPRMNTLRGLRRRGYTPEALRAFCAEVGVARFKGIIDFVRLENALREDLNRRAERRLAVLRPLKVVITNWADGGDADRTEMLPAINNPEDASAGSREVAFTREFYIEREDFMEDAPRKFFRLAPGREVRLRYAYFVTCTNVVKDDAGEIVELHCTYDPATRGGDSPDGRKVKGTLHWVSAAHAIDAEVRLYDHLFAVEHPEDVSEADEAAGKDWKSNINPNSLDVLTGCKLEPSLATPPADVPVQFERLGYFVADKDSAPGRAVFNRTVTLKDAWAKIAKQGNA